jgi:hypothetical protein
MMKKIVTVVIVGLLACSTFALFSTIKPVAGYDWTTVNADLFSSGTPWHFARWDYPADPTYNPINSTDNGVVTTGMYTYNDTIFDDLAYAQDDLGIAATATQKVCFDVKLVDWSLPDNSYYDPFFEVWCTIRYPAGTTATVELMVRLQIYTDTMVHGANYTDGWTYDPNNYFVIYDWQTDLSDWSSYEIDMNYHLLNPLAQHYGVNLSDLTVDGITFGVEGHSNSGGGMTFQWRNFSYKVDNARYITIEGSEYGQTNFGNTTTTFITSGYPHITVYPNPGYTFSAWQVTVDTNTWTESPWNPCDVIYDYAIVQPIFEPATYWLTINAYDDYLSAPSTTAVLLDGNYVGTVGTEPVSMQVSYGDHTITLDYRAYNIGWSYYTTIEGVSGGNYNIYSETPVIVYLSVVSDTTLNAVYSWAQG